MAESKGIRSSTLLVVVAVVGAAAFAAGRSGTTTAPTEPGPAPEPVAQREAPHAAAPVADPTALPPGHPPVGAGAPGLPSSQAGQADEPAASLAWTTPARWQKVPNASTMRLATFRIPRATGDTEDPEMSVMQAGGNLDANIDRWVGQFADDGTRASRRATKKVGTLAVTIVEIEGSFAGGMGKDTNGGKGWALLGAIVETPGMPHFFKMTGPQKSVKAARAELDALVASLRVGS